MRATVSAALPALTVLTATIERLGQSCASAAGARVTRTAPAMAPHAKRNDIATSLECREVLIDFVAHVGLSGGARRPMAPSRPPSREHDAPNRPAQATGRARPAVARRTRAGGRSTGSATTHSLEPVGF